MEHGVAVVAVMTAGTGGGSGVRSGVFLDFFIRLAEDAENPTAPHNKPVPGGSARSLG